MKKERYIGLNISAKTNDKNDGAKLLLLRPNILHYILTYINN